MIGAGGGFIIVPVLLLFFKVPHQMAVGTSLCVVFLNAASGSYSYIKQKMVDWRAAPIFALATIPGAIIGVYFSAQLSGKVFNIIFGISLLILSLYLIINPEKRKNLNEENKPIKKKRFYIERTILSSDGHKYSYSYHEPAGFLLSMVVGFISSLLGIGGGIIHVPALIQLFSFPAHVAIASSHFILALTAFVGALGHIIVGDVLVKEAIYMGAGVVIGAQFGAKLAKKIRAPLLVRLLALALLAVGIRLLIVA